MVTSIDETVLRLLTFIQPHGCMVGVQYPLDNLGNQEPGKVAYGLDDLEAGCIRTPEDAQPLTGDRKVKVDPSQSPMSYRTIGQG